MSLIRRRESENYYTSFEAEDLQQSSSSCSQGHRSSLQLETSEGGSICLLCFCNLISNPNSPSVHLSYALSQLSQAISHFPFLQNLRNFHAHLLISPLTNLLFTCNDEPISRQATDLVLNLCDSDDFEVYVDFVARIADRLSSSSLAWSKRQIYSLHCLGLLLNRQIDKPEPLAHIKNTKALIFNLIAGLQLPSEEIRGEILFVLYKLSVLEGTAIDNVDDFLDFCPKLLQLSLDTLMKTQSDEVRLNCIALLTVLAQKDYLRSSLFTYDQTSGNLTEVDNFMQEEELSRPLVVLFAESIKGPLLSSNTEVQIGTLDLIFHSLTCQGSAAENIAVLVEQGIVDYVFEILRLSGKKDKVINSCIRVLDLLSAAEPPFSQKLAIGFQALVPILRYVAEVPFHPVQFHTLKLIWICLYNCPGIVSRSQVEELVLILTGVFKRHRSGELGMLPETFVTCCSIFVAILKSPFSHGILNLIPSVQEASTNAVLSCFCDSKKYPSQLLLYSLYLLKEAYAFIHEENANNGSNDITVESCTTQVCETHVLPWLRRALDETEEEDNILGILETFHSILLQGSDVETRKFAEVLATSSWFSLSFGCLGLFPTEKMKCRVYLMLGSLVDRVLGHDLGQLIRDAALYLPSDPLDLLFLLGQKSCHDMELLSCQSAVLLLLYCSSLYDDRLAEEKQVLASLEQYILVNNDNFSSGLSDSVALVPLVNLYGLLRGTAVISYQTIPYSTEAEKVLFDLVLENELDLLSSRFHPVSLKWLFQQEKICMPLSKQILNFCRLNSINGNHIIVHGNNNHIDIQAIAELVAFGDSLGAKFMVSLLMQLQEEEGQEEDITSVLNLMNTVLNIFPAASNQLWMYGIGREIQNLYYSLSYSSSDRIFKLCSLLMFNVLRSIEAETLFHHEEVWLPLIIKFLEVLNSTMLADAFSQEGLIVIGILSLVLRLYNNKALVEASKAILLNTSLVSTMNTVIQSACSKGPALVDHDEETLTGETLIFLLLLYFYSLRSVQALLPGTLDWQNCLELSNSGTQTFPVICIRCHDLCRLLHFGSPQVKLVASHCLLELLTRISDQRCPGLDELKCSVGYVMSILAVLQGLVFDSDIRVAINCGICISTILGWDIQERKLTRDDKWSRLVVEELSLSFTAPGLASKSFTNQHKAATHIAVALLRLNQVPAWMKSVFNSSCISGIVKNLSASNVSAEMVQLFLMLLVSDYLSKEHVACLNHVFQVFLWPK
ncbi:hypothetical protein AQUCO_05800113v1 [Aquilegia coerulea]|uniref:Protein PRD1 n=1 Tax=Aquilegia coerulea TaxID=218851 RepID=A0A2G5CEV4_AQUCA|nr:hypothetical protein AQUCO_05800113v1 [Aquilegia coerulea]